MDSAANGFVPSIEPPPPPILRRRGRRQPGHRARVDEPTSRAFHTLDLLRARLVRMTAAHEVPVAGAGHGVAVFGVMHHENLAAAELEARIRPVVMQLAVALPCPT